MISKLGPKRIAVLVAVAVLLVVGMAVSSSLVETNNAGWYQVKQAAVTGNMSVRTTPGVYGQLFGDIHDYKISDMNYFSVHAHEGGSGVTAAPIQVRFNDGGTADISGSLKFRLSLKDIDQLRLHEDFKSYDAVQQDLIRQTLTESLMQTATLMRAEESYSTRRSEFTTLAEEQVENGIFETVSQEVVKKDAEGNEFVDRFVQVKRDADGNAVVRKRSPLLRYNIEVLQFVIKEIDFDATIDALIAKKKEAEQAKVVAKSNAERAKQDAITEYEQGQARIAKAKADEEVLKITDVTRAKKDKEVGELQAKKEFEIAKFNRQRDEQVAAANLAIKRAEAEAAKLLVKAGLTPMQKAVIDKETAIGVATALSNVKLPSTFIGGGGSGGSVDPFTAIGLEALFNMSKRLGTAK